MVSARAVLLSVGCILLILTAVHARTVITDKSIKINNYDVVLLIEGNSSDTKPSDVPIGTLFLEKDTGAIYTFDGQVWKQLASKAYVDSTKVNKSGDTLTGNLNMGGNDITNTADIYPQTDNVSSIGSASYRYNRIYVYALYTGDLKFANGWVLTEAENLGMGTGLVLLSPDGRVYPLTANTGNSGYDVNEATIAINGVAGFFVGLGVGVGVVIANKKLMG